MESVTDDHGVEQEIEVDLERAEESASKDLLRFYELALRREWKTNDLPWGELPADP